ncbi:tetra-peptide repeat homeobox protein 1-like [Periplaneta americana]|uniref:tetra-peptide repeat homeobox protein 1-like n=1 Tax=Periplaneta americana TaxID=6978 RepID=UPI0037E7CB45
MMSFSPVKNSGRKLSPQSDVRVGDTGEGRFMPEHEKEERRLTTATGTGATLQPDRQEENDKMETPMMVEASSSDQQRAFNNWNAEWEKRVRQGDLQNLKNLEAGLHYFQFDSREDLPGYMEDKPGTIPQTTPATMTEPIPAHMLDPMPPPVPHSVPPPVPPPVPPHVPSPVPSPVPAPSLQNPPEEEDDNRTKSCCWRFLRYLFCGLLPMSNRRPPSMPAPMSSPMIDSMPALMQDTISVPIPETMSTPMPEPIPDPMRASMQDIIPAPMSSHILDPVPAPMPTGMPAPTPRAMSLWSRLRYRFRGPAPISFDMPFRRPARMPSPMPDRMPPPYSNYLPAEDRSNTTTSARFHVSAYARIHARSHAGSHV